MKTLYIECNMGAAGDMLTGALLELLPEPERFLETMNAAGIPGLRMSRVRKSSCGILGTHMVVEIGGEEELCPDVPEGGEEEAPDEHGHHHEHEHHHDHDHEHHHDEHHHASFPEVCAQIDALNLPEAVRAEAKAVYSLLAEAEAHAHGCDAESLHFHEVGMLDAITDVCAVCLAMSELRPERVVVSPIHTGFGQVRCAHGILPVPTPATAYLLRDMPASAGSIRGELLTPTGAALLKHFAMEYGWMPPMRVEKLGCGMGTKDFPAANCVRAFWGEDEARQADEVWELSCNLDDMTGEAIGFATERLMAEGALDVWLTSIQMKKGRPGVKLSMLCKFGDRAKFEALMLRHTSTLGVRSQRLERAILPRQAVIADTELGMIHAKFSRGDGYQREKVEYEDIARLARARGISFEEACGLIERAL